MGPELIAVVVAGGFGVAGTILGVVMTTWLGRSAGSGVWPLKTTVVGSLIDGGSMRHS